jgi:nucleoside-diphosphate-sugar epimerase
VASSNAILSTVPPNKTGDPVFQIFGAHVLRQTGCSSWLGYLSTTGVYGDWDGGTVDEQSELRATSERGARRIAAENSWLDLSRKFGRQAHIFRLAGIYGPGRNVLAKIRSGTARRINKPDHLFSRIHVEDIVLVLKSSILRPRAGAIYNVCDNEPCSQDQVVTYGCKIIGEAVPPLLDFENAVADMSAMARSFWSDNRVVDNRLMRDEFKIALRFPTYREGLKALANDTMGMKA